MCIRDSPLDATEWIDRNGDGIGDNGKPLTTMDHMRLNPEITIVGLGMALSLVSAAVAFTVGRKRFGDEYFEDHEDSEYDEYESYSDWDDQY